MKNKTEKENATKLSNMRETASQRLWNEIEEQNVARGFNINKKPLTKLSNCCLLDFKKVKHF